MPPNQHEDLMREWQNSLMVLPANFQGLRTFRQFYLSDGGLCPKFVDDFTLKSINRIYNWRPGHNEAFCKISSAPHKVNEGGCTCGFYGSYSSQIIYQPTLLRNSSCCFGVIRQYGDVVLAQNGLRSSGAEIEGLLFHPENRYHRLILKFWSRLEQEGIYFTTSTKAFLKRFPDESYTSILKFDPVKRLSEKVKVILESRAYDVGSDDFTNTHHSDHFCRPLRPEMLQYRLTEQSAPNITGYELSIKPEYRPGGKLYRHPLLEFWPTA